MPSNLLGCVPESGTSSLTGDASIIFSVFLSYFRHKWFSSHGWFCKRKILTLFLVINFNPF